MYTHAIITFTKGYALISTDDLKRLKTIGAEEWFRYDGGKIKGSAIAEIIEIGEFYTRFPDRRPVHYDEFKENREEYKPTNFGHKRMIE